MENENLVEIDDVEMMATIIKDIIDKKRDINKIFPIQKYDIKDILVQMEEIYK